jgi:hypothetical protein
MSDAGVLNQSNACFRWFPLPLSVTESRRNLSGFDHCREAAVVIAPALDFLVHDRQGDLGIIVHEKI